MKKSESRSTPATSGLEILAEFELPSVEGNEREVMDRVAAAVAGLGIPGPRFENLKTAVAEAAMNAIEHGNEGDATLSVGVRVMATSGDVRVLITDRGGGGRQEMPEVEMPDLDGKLAGLQKPRGWGLFLIENMVDEINVSSNDTNHTIELVLHLKGRQHDGS